MNQAVAGGCLALLAGAAQAALWGYVDGGGVAHFADRQLDSRYGLVLGDAAPAPVAAAKVPGTKVPGKSTSWSGMLTWLEIAPEVKRVQPWLREASRSHGVDIELLNALIAVESGFNAGAISPRGAVGLMQVMPGTAERYSTRSEMQRDVVERLSDPRVNIQIGTRALADLLRRHRSIDIALAAWSAGEDAVRRSGGKMPPYDETRAHVQQVLELYWALLQRSRSRDAQQMKLHP
jgi:soluble lytic murein transglycosylase-like protein